MTHAISLRKLFFTKAGLRTFYWTTVKEDSGQPFGSAAHKQYVRDKIIGDRVGVAYATAAFLFLLIPTVVVAWLIPAYSMSLLWKTPFYFLFFNGFEYWFHRYPMHRKMRTLEHIYEHVTVHHNFYTDERYFFEDPKDYYTVIIPIHISSFILVSIAVLASLIYLVSDLSNALFFALCGYLYYLAYEFLHFLSHTRENNPLKRMFPPLAKLADFHRVHHRTDIMSKYNFNIAFPIFDLILGTVYKGPKKP